MTVFVIMRFVDGNPNGSIPNSKLWAVCLSENDAKQCIKETIEEAAPQNSEKYFSSNGCVAHYRINDEQIRFCIYPVEIYHKKDSKTTIQSDGWITDRLPEEIQQKETVNGKLREWTESESVLAWDSMYGPMIDYTINGKWKSKSNKGFDIQAVHGIVAWRPIPPFEEKKG